MTGGGQIWGRVLGIEVAALGLTLLIVGGLLARNAVKGRHLKNGWLVSTNDQNPGEPQWYHRASTFGVGVALVLLGIWVTLRTFLL